MKGREMDVRRGIVTEERERSWSGSGLGLFWLLQARGTGYLALPGDLWREGGASAAFYYWGLESSAVLEDLYL